MVRLQRQVKSEFVSMGSEGDDQLLHAAAGRRAVVERLAACATLPMAWGRAASRRAAPRAGVTAPRWAMTTTVDGNGRTGLRVIAQWVMLREGFLPQRISSRFRGFCAQRLGPSMRDPSLRLSRMSGISPTSNLACGDYPMGIRELHDYS